MRKALAILAALVLTVAASSAAAQVEPAHREAIQRYFEASRTVAFLRHFALPIEIRTAAVERWDFEPNRLGLDEILAMEQKLDVAAFERRLIEIHARHITAADADAVAVAYGSPALRRYLAAGMGQGFLPSTDPLLRDGVPEESKADKEAMLAFLRTPVGMRLKTVEKQVIAEVFALLREQADLAVERYVAERGLPNRRRP